jgi:hypothetical protein
MKHKLDEQIKKIFEQGEFEYNAQNWDDLKARLAKDKSDKTTYLMPFVFFSSQTKKWFTAASVATILGIGYFISKQASILETKESNIVQLSTTVPSEESSVEKETTKPTSTTKPIAKINAFNTLTTSTKKWQSSKSNPTFTTLGPNANTISPTNILTENEVSSHLAEQSEQEKSITAVNREERSPDLAVEPPTDKRKLLEFTTHDIASQIKHGGLSLYGSIGMGSNQSAFAAGLTYQINMSSKFFVDGDMQFTSSRLNNVALFKENDQTKLDNFTSTEVSGILPTVGFENKNQELVIQSLQYAHLSFNPSLGYRISKHISIKTGVDIQQRLSNNQTLNYISQNDQLILLPKMDIGVTPKIEYDLTDRWRTTMMYRKGINQWVNDKAVFNRNYLQVQLGFKL